MNFLTFGAVISMLILFSSCALTEKPEVSSKAHESCDSGLPCDQKDINGCCCKDIDGKACPIKNKHNPPKS